MRAPLTASQPIRHRIEGRSIVVELTVTVTAGQRIFRVETLNSGGLDQQWTRSFRDEQPARDFARTAAYTLTPTVPALAA